MRFREFDAQSGREGREIPKLHYGIPFLDDVTGGIRKNDFVVIGGRTGAGKTSLSSLIACHNARNLKNVFIFNLEAESGEFENRVLFRMFSSEYKKLGRPDHVYYRDFLQGKYEGHNEIMQKIENAADIEYATLFIRERDGNFSLQDFEQEMEEIADEADLIILDHLHHFDDDNTDEVQSVKRAIKKMRDKCLIHSVPIVTIAHFRKADTNSKRLVPDLEEFHGSSEIGKEATIAITLAPYNEPIEERTFQSADFLYPTLFKICKGRHGVSTKYIGKHYFSSQTNNYEGKYRLNLLAKGGTELESVDFNYYPYWSRYKDGNL